MSSHTTAHDDKAKLESRLLHGRCWILMVRLPPMVSHAAAAAPCEVGFCLGSVLLCCRVYPLSTLPSVSASHQSIQMNPSVAVAVHQPKIGNICTVGGGGGRNENKLNPGECTEPKGTTTAQRLYVGTHTYPIILGTPKDLMQQILTLRRRGGKTRRRRRRRRKRRRVNKISNK